jgi:hypothetical protein
MGADRLRRTELIRRLEVAGDDDALAQALAREERDRGGH